MFSPLFSRDFFRCKQSKSKYAYILLLIKKLPQTDRYGVARFLLKG